MSTAAVIQTAYLGDVVLTTPLIETLAQKYGPVHVVTTPENAPLLETLPTVSSVIPYDKRRTHRGISGILHIAKALKHHAPDHVFIPHQSIRSAIVARLAGIPNRIGFPGLPVSWLYTERRAPKLTAIHEAERLHALAGEDLATPHPRIVMTEMDRRGATQALQEAGVARDYIVLAPGSRWATKRWPYYRGLAERLSHDHNVVLVGGPEDKKTGTDIVTGKNGIANLTGRLSIRESAAVLANARLVVCNDSVALHLAGAVETPVVAIFGPTDPSLGFGPRGPKDLVAGVHNLACRPCSTHGGARCPLQHHRCMVDLEVETVANMVHNALQEEASRECAS